MFIFPIDEILDNLLDKFYEDVEKSKIYSEILREKNFVRFQQKMISFIEDFMTKHEKEINLKDKKENINNYVKQSIKTYLYYYFFIGLCYDYNGGRDTFITNIIEISKNQAKSKVSIKDFFTSDSNSRIIKYYGIIKNILELVPLKTLDKIKIALVNAPIKFQETIELINNLGEEFFLKRIVENENNFHTLIKTIVIKEIYLKLDRNNLISIVEDEEEAEGDFTYITVVTSSSSKMVDFNTIEKLLTPTQIREGMADDIYSYILEHKQKVKQYNLDKDKNVDYLFSKRILIPIVEDFLRYHKNNEKYQTGEKSTKDETKAKYIISKLNQIKNYYSQNLKANPKLKLNVKNMFYNSLMHRMATLVNIEEDIRIKNKLIIADTPQTDEILNDIENLSNYSYLNFNHFSKDGFKIRTSEVVDGIRYVNLKKDFVDKYLETRIGNDLIDLNVIGVAFNEDKIRPNLVLTKNLKVPNEGSYQDFLKQVNNQVKKNKSDEILYYWLFDTKKDEITTETYEDVAGGDVDRTIKVFLQDFYYQYYNILLDKIKNEIKDKNINSQKKLFKLIDLYTEQYADLAREPEIYNEIFKYFNSRIKNIKITEDDIENIIPGSKNQQKFKLPVIKIEKPKSKVIVVEKEDKTDYSELISYKSLCIHHLIWQGIQEMNKKDIDTFNQKVFDFVKQYVKENQNKDYVCKSCDEIIPLQKYQITGTYVEELDTFMTTAVGISRPLESLPKYKKLSRTIRTVDRIIENISFSSNIRILLGNDPIIKLRRRLMTKDIIDIVQLHTKYIKQTIKQRPSLFQSRYGILPSLTNLFFFELKDDIFLTSSKDTDKFKIIKYNNMVTYLIFLILLEISSGQLLGLKENKQNNFYLFQKFNSVFSKLKLRLSETELIPLSKIPLLSYAIYYLSAVTVKQNIWLYQEDDPKSFNFNAQKEIIHTLVDLFNSIMEANFRKDKNILYEIMVTRIKTRLNNTYNDTKMFERIKKERLQMISTQGNKIRYLEKKVNPISLEDNKQKDVKLTQKDYDFCYTKKSRLDRLEFNYVIHELSKEKLEKITNKQIRRILKKVCSDKKDNSIVQKLCDKYGPDFEKDLDMKDIELIRQNLAKEEDKKQMKLEMEYRKNKLNQQKKLDRKQQVIKSYQEIFNKPNIIESFVKNIKNLIGSKIKTEKLTLYLNDDQIIIDHDYLGNPKKEIKNILKLDLGLKEEIKHPFFNTDVFYFFDDKVKLHLYYDKFELQYLGYSKDKKQFQKIFSKDNLKISYSLRNMIEAFGCKNYYEKISYYFDKIPENKNDIVNKILNERVNRMRNLIQKANSVINQVKYKKNNKSNTKEANLVEEFINRLPDFNLKNSQGKDSIFKNWKYIYSLEIEKIKEKVLISNDKYFDIQILNKLNNLDKKLINYLIHNLYLLIQYNPSRRIQNELTYFIVSLIKFLFEYYYQEINHLELRKFAILIDNEDPGLDPSYKVIGMYQELIKTEELESEEYQDKIIDAQEAAESLDYDDYEIIDGQTEEPMFEIDSMSIFD